MRAILWVYSTPYHPGCQSQMKVWIRIPYPKNGIIRVETVFLGGEVVPSYTHENQLQGKITMKLSMGLRGKN